MKKIIVAFNFVFALFLAQGSNAQILPIMPDPNHDTDHDALITGTVTVQGDGQTLSGIVAILSRVEPGLDDVPVSHALSDANGNFTLTGQAGITYRVTYQYPTAGFSSSTGNPSAPVTVTAGANPVQGLVLTRNENAITNCNVSAIQATNWIQEDLLVAKAQSTSGATLNSVSVFFSASVVNPQIEMVAGATESVYSVLDIGANVAISGPSNTPRHTLASLKSFAGDWEGEEIVLSPGERLTYHDISSASTQNTLLSTVPVAYTGTGDVSFRVDAKARTTTSSTNGNAAFELTTDAVAGVCLTYIYASNPLPVRLASFSVKAQEVEKNQIVAVQWTTTMETNSDRFEIEKSADAKNWNVIGSENASRESSQLTKYNFKDYTPFQGKSYYRLKMVDLDGTFAYSRIVSAELAGDGTTLTVYPNPVANELFVKSSESETFKSVSIFNSNGQMVYNSASVSHDKGINVRNLSKGIYLVKTTTEDGRTQSKKLLINR